MTRAFCETCNQSARTFAEIDHVRASHLNVERANEHPETRVTFGAMTDGELERSAQRAWRQAARSWQEYRAIPATKANAAVRAMVRASAVEDDRFWRALRAEQETRKSAEGKV